MHENPFQQYVESGLIYRHEGCTEAEVQAISSCYPRKLPSAYVNFLRIAGRSFNSFDQIRWGWDGMKTVAEIVQRYLDDTGKTIQVRDTDVFFWQDEYSYGIFNLEEGDDPPVYWYDVSQADDEFCRVADSFTAFVDILVQEGRPISNWCTYDMVLFKEVLRGKSEIRPFHETNLAYQVSVPPTIGKRLDQEFIGLERTVAHRLLADLAKEKAQFLIKDIGYLEVILDLAKGDFNRLSSIYHECVIRYLEKDFPEILGKYESNR